MAGLPTRSTAAPATAHRCRTLSIRRKTREKVSRILGSAPQPCGLPPLLRFARARFEFEAPLPRRFGPERDVQTHQPVAPRHQKGDLVARLVLLQAGRQLV